MRTQLAFVFSLLVSSTFTAFCPISTMQAQEIQTEVVEYSDGDVVLEGFVAWNPKAVAGAKAPGILVVHQWLGLTDYEKSRCKQLAELGYVAFALDIYGQGIRPDNVADASKQATIYKTDRALYRHRLKLGLEQLRAVPGVAPNQIAAIGYCFGGTGAIELARSGADIAGVVSFHGGLDSPSPADGKNIKAKILVEHGADDPFVPAAEIEAFKKEMNDAEVDWQMNLYSGTVHSFTQPMAGNDNSAGAAFNQQSDRRSWASMRNFFDELFATD